MQYQISIKMGAERLSDNSLQDAIDLEWERNRLLGCHSREGGNPVFPGFSGLPPEFTPAKAEAGVTVEVPIPLSI